MSTRLVVLLISLFAAAVAGGVGIYYSAREEPVEQAATAPAPDEGEPADGETRETAEPDDEPAAPGDNTEAAKGVPPRLDIIRVEPSGEAVAAGTAAPRAKVEMLLDGEVVASGEANASGEWSLVPSDPIPQGAHDLVFRATGPDGEGEWVEGDRVAVVIEGPEEVPMVAVTPPDAPSQVVQRPDGDSAPGDGADTGDETRIAQADEPATDAAQGAAGEPGSDSDGSAPAGRMPEGGAAATEGEPDPARQAADAGQAGEATSPSAPAGAVDSAATTPAEGEPGDAGGDSGASGLVVIDTVEVEPPADLYVSGDAPPDAAVRVYLNNEPVAETHADETGNWSASVERDLPPGRYSVRADSLDAEGEVEARAEVRFDRVRIAAADEPSADEAPQPQAASDGAAAEGGEGADVAAGTDAPSDSRESVAVEGVPGDEAIAVSDRPLSVNISRGDNLWSIARSIYGRGVRYTVIYDANRGQIADPDLIYPGQIFTVPVDEDAGDE